MNLRLEVAEDGHITVSLEDFLGIDENNLAVTLLFSKSAQLRCSRQPLRSLAASSSLSLIRQMAAIVFAPFDLWRFPDFSPGALRMLKFHHRRCADSVAHGSYL